MAKAVKLADIAERVGVSTQKHCPDKKASVRK